MTDLSSYDAAIVKAAEDLVRILPHRTSLGLDAMQLVDAVKAKHEAQKPRCNVNLCYERAVQRLASPVLESVFFRCEEHRITVTEL